MPTSRLFPPLPAAHENAAARGIQIAFGETERLTDAKPRAPKEHDQSSGSQPMGRLPGAAHDRDDLLDGRGIGGIL